MNDDELRQCVKDIKAITIGLGFIVFVLLLHELGIVPMPKLFE